jgi:CBS domain-containing protein
VYRFLEYRVEHVMTADPVTISPNTTLGEAERIFEQHDFDALPVLEDGGRVVGMLSKLDLCKAFAFTPTRMVPPYEEIIGQPAEVVMTRDFVPVAPDLPLTRALQAMIEASTKSLPVVEGGRLLGIVAREDVLRAIRRAAEGHGPVQEGRGRSLR